MPCMVVLYLVSVMVIIIWNLALAVIVGAYEVVEVMRLAASFCNVP